MSRRFTTMLATLALAIVPVQAGAAFAGPMPPMPPGTTPPGATQPDAAGSGSGSGSSPPMDAREMMKHMVTNAQRKAAAKNAAAKGKPRSRLGKGKGAVAAANVLDPNAPPDYFGTTPNWANSPLPELDGLGNVVPGTGIRKFVDSMAGVGFANRNNLNNYLPIANPDTITYPGSDYYEIALKQYTQQLHSDLPPTTLRGYVQLNNGTDLSGHNTIVPPTHPYFLGPVIQSFRNRPVRVKFINMLPTGLGGDLFLPVDTTAMGAGTGPLGGSVKYTQNRATIHLHGGLTAWISDGTPHQWITPATESTPYPKGVSVTNVPDMPDPGPGAETFFYTNQHSARLLWYHDHTLGMTRLNVYAGEAAPYFTDDQVERQMIHDGVLPSDNIPLVIQDKTFVPNDTQLAAEDPTWNKATWGGEGNLWFPHVYMPNQNPYDMSGSNPMGRWDYGPWFWPPYTGLVHGPVANPYYDPVLRPWEPPLQPGTPTPSLTPEAFMDTPLVNGTVYPYLTVQRKSYRFRILNASNDRMWNLQLYCAKSNGTMWNPDGTLNDPDAGEVAMVPAVRTPGYPSTWPTDGREGGVPDPAAAGPSMIVVGNEGGLIPGASVLPNQPVNYDYNRRSITVLNVTTKTLFLGPAERADVIVDFTESPGCSNIILYNDAPAPVPAFDTRVDYYTGDPDQTDTGGAPTTQPGYGPNTRTVMQFRVEGPAAAPYDMALLNTRLPISYGASQNKPIVPEIAYNAAFGTSTAVNTYGTIFGNSLNWTGLPAPINLGPKAIQELFETQFGRMNATLGVELPNTSAQVQTTIPLGYIDPPTEIMKFSNLLTPVGSAGDGTQIWKITHNGVDTHAVHVHEFDVQVINRVGWDGAMMPPDPDELGWKDTVRMHPLEDIIVALRADQPVLPFKLGDSIRPLDPTQPLGVSTGFTQIDPATGNPKVVTNQIYNFGWEHIWHCHILGHEENDMMRTMVFNVSPAPPTNLSVTLSNNNTRANLAWVNNATTPAATSMVIQRSTNRDFASGVTTFTLGPTATSYVDTPITSGVRYFYRVRAENATSYSAWTNAVTVPSFTPTGLTATNSAAAPLTVTAAWTNQFTADAVTLQRATNSSFTANLITVALPGSTTSYVDAAVVPAQQYYYRVQATYAGTNSNWSSTASVTTPTTPAVPGNFRLTTAVGAGLATVTTTWTEGSTVTSFVIQRSTNSTFTAGLAVINLVGTARTYKDGGLPRNTRFYYRIQAVNGGTSSAFTAGVSIVTPP